MWKIFSTDDHKVRDKFRLWRETSHERLPPVELRNLCDAPFDAHLEAATIGSLSIMRAKFSPYQMSSNSDSARENAKHDKIVALFRIGGLAHTVQYGRTISQCPGDLVFIDAGAPLAFNYENPMHTLRVELPRKRLESMLGPARLFAAVPIGRDLPGAGLARTFFEELVRVHETMSPETAERMSSIGADLLVASLAERMAQDTPKPIQGTITVQRAKAYVETHLEDPSLDPPKLAAAVGVSLRRLQELFHAHGRHISDWIWERRLATAAQRLIDPGRAHLSIGAISYGCGFASQTHFSTRFRARFGMSPREYRRAALLREP